MRNNPEKNNLTKWKLTTFYIFIVSFALTGAIDEKVSSPLPTSATSSKQSTTSLAPSSSSPHSTNEEIYIDDEPGSGHGGIHEDPDLEKNSDYSGSGFGPDDEDSIGNNNSRNNNNKYHKQPSETGGTYSSNKYNNIGVGGNSNNNNGNEHTSISSTTSSTSTTRHKPIPSNSDLSFDVDREDDKNDNDDEYESSGDDFDDDDTTDTDHDDDGFGKQPTNNSKDNGNTENVAKKDEPIDKPINNNNNNDDNDDKEIYDDNKDDSKKEVISNGNDDGGHVLDKFDDDDDNDDNNNTTNIQPNSTESSNKDIIINNNNEVVPGEEIGRTNINPPGGVNPGPNEVLIMNEDRATSFFAQPGILAAVIGGAVVGLLCAILVVMFIVYRMRKKDEGSYALDEPKRSPAVNSYAKNGNNREFYA